MVRKGSAKYSPMSSPAPTRMRSPDMDLMRDKKHLRLILEIADFARENWKGIRGPRGGVERSPALGKLEYNLLDMTNPGGEGDPSDAPSIVANARLGYVIGTMENGSGVARAGECECHYTTAMGIVSSEIAQMATPTAMSEFALETGYYLARTNDRTIDALLAIANRNVDALREDPNRLSSIEQESEVALAGLDSAYGGVIYDVGTWRHAKVVKLIAALEVAGIPYQWEDEEEEGVLVDCQFEAAVDKLIGEL